MAGIINWGLTLFVVVLSYMLLSNILDVKISSIVKDLRKWLREFLKSSSSELEKRNRKIFETQTFDEKNRSLYYSFMKLVSQIMKDLHITDVTPEYLVVFVGLASLVVSFICNLFGMSLISDVLMFVTCFITIWCLLYLKSRKSHRKRVEAIRDAEDLICQNIEPSVLKTIKDVIPKIDPIIRLEFEKFLVNEKSIFIYAALKQLNEDIGPEFDNLIGKLIKLEKEGKPGMLDAFKSNITRNAIQREYEAEEKQKEDEDTQEFLLCLGVVLVTFFGSFFGFTELRHFYMSIGGQILILTCALIILGIFCYCQMVQNKRYW